VLSWRHETSLRVPPLTEAQRSELDALYRTTKKPRLRTRVQMVLLSVEHGLKATAIAPIVRESDDTVLRWLKRYLAEGANGLSDAPMPGRPSKVTELCWLHLSSSRMAGASWH
jgi:hypothetical protein